jgi:hypothetical protein
LRSSINSNIYFVGKLLLGGGGSKLPDFCPGPALKADLNGLDLSVGVPVFPGNWTDVLCLLCGPISSSIFCFHFHCVLSAFSQFSICSVWYCSYMGQYCTVGCQRSSKLISGQRVVMIKIGQYIPLTPLFKYLGKRMPWQLAYHLLVAGTMPRRLVVSHPRQSFSESRTTRATSSSAPFKNASIQCCDRQRLTSTPLV